MLLANPNDPHPGTSRRIRAVLLGLAMAFAGAPADAQVAHGFRLLPDSQTTISTQRAYFAYEAAAGRVIQDGIVVRNETEGPLRLSLFAADTVTASRGGIAVASRRGDPPEHAGSWLDISQDELTLEPEEARVVPFTLRLPPALSPGEYAASIVAQRAGEDDAGEAGLMGVRFIPRFAVTVLVTVTGSETDALQPDLGITDLRARTGRRQQTVIADLSNRGNDGLDRAEGLLSVRQTDGVLVQEMPVRLGYFLARDDLDYRIGLQPEVAAGEYDVTLSLSHRLGTVELTRRLYLGAVTEIPVVRAETLTESSPSGAPTLPRWVIYAIGAAGISIVLLMAIVAVQSRRLSRERSKRV